MDVLFTYCGYDCQSERKLREALRSLDVYGRNLGRVVVAGAPPSWLSDEVVSFVSPLPTSKRPKMETAFKIITHAFSSGVVGGHLLYSPEGVSLGETVDLNNYPWYFRRDVIRSIEDHVMSSRGGALITRYKMALADTRKVLERNGYRAVEMSGHFLSHIDGEDLSEVKRLFEDDPRGLFGYDIGCLFGNVARERFFFTPTLAQECFPEIPRNNLRLDEKSRFEK